MKILEEILVKKIKEVESAKIRVPVATLEKSTYFDRRTSSLMSSILDSHRTSVIAEFKRRSPSGGNINEFASVKEITTGYSLNGASGLSVLTDSGFFGGSAADLINAREVNDIPILRKDFIIDEYQLVESKAIGADAVLLIASALEINETAKLAKLAKSLGLQVLLEIHNEEEIKYINEFVDIVGVNNRDLTTFKVDLDLSLRLAAKIPDSLVRISESGILSPGVIGELKKNGYDGFLIGENFMKSNDPVSAFKEFVGQIKTYKDES